MISEILLGALRGAVFAAAGGDGCTDPPAVLPAKVAYVPGMWIAIHADDVTDLGFEDILETLVQSVGCVHCPGPGGVH